MPLGQVAAGAGAKQRLCTCAALPLYVGVRELAPQALLCLLERGVAEAQANARAVVALVDEGVAGGVGRDAGGGGSPPSGASLVGPYLPLFSPSVSLPSDVVDRSDPYNGAGRVGLATAVAPASARLARAPMRISMAS